MLLCFTHTLSYPKAIHGVLLLFSFFRPDELFRQIFIPWWSSVVFNIWNEVFQWVCSSLHLLSVLFVYNEKKFIFNAARITLVRPMWIGLFVVHTIYSKNWLVLYGIYQPGWNTWSIFYDWNFELCPFRSGEEWGFRNEVENAR